jgi:post-segregation antitoxin (ccd killing protein)
MSKILLYVDEDSMDEDFVQALRARNVDVLTVADVGMLHESDEEQLVWARENSRVIFSFNARDFYPQIRIIQLCAVESDEPCNS